MMNKTALPLFLLMLFALSACDTPSTTPQTADLETVGLLADATRDQVTHSMNATSAAVAADVATMQAVVAAKETQEAAAARATATAQTIAQATAQSAAMNKEAIELSALEGRLAAETRATVAAFNADITQAAKDAERRAWVIDVLWGVGILFLIGMGSALIATAWRIARTLRDEDGQVIGYGRTMFLPHEAAPTIIDHAPRQMPFTSKGGTQAVPLYRRGFRLTHPQTGELVYTFTGRDLDAMEKNITNGDDGFRRNKSGAGDGLDTLANISNGGLFSSILEAMLAWEWVSPSGNGHKWTAQGMRELLDANAPPHSA